MKQRDLNMIFFLCLAAAQALAALYLVWHWEDVLKSGQSYRWQTAPVDPYDALHGRYLAFSFKSFRAPVSGEAVAAGEYAYGVLERDERGYAVLRHVQKTRPEKGDYLRLSVTQVLSGQAVVKLPFERFYLEEGFSTEAEKNFRAAAGRESCIAVRIKNGEAVIEELYIENVPLREYLQH